MKRNILPLLGIAIVVAILSTGVFYGLFAGKLRSASADIAGTPVVVASHDLERGKLLEPGDLKVIDVRGPLAGSFSSPALVTGASLIAAVKQNEPILEERVVTNSPASNPSSHGSVPQGLRGVSIRVSESDGIIGSLRPGAKVDVQAVQDRTGGPELRTILQNIEVVSVNPQTQPAAGNRGPVSIVTVLVNPEDSDVLAIADAGARLRLALRNPLDDKTSARHALSAGSVFQSSAAAEAPRIFAAYAPSAAALQFDVKVLRASESAAGQLEGKLDPAANADSATVSAFPASVDTEKMIEKLASQHELSILAERTLASNGGRPAWFRTGPAAGQLGIELFPEPAPGGRPKLKIREEVVWQTRAGAETRRFESGVPLSGSFLLRRVVDDAREGSTLERMFPGYSWNGEHLLILITSRESGETAAHHDRGR